VTAVNSTLIGRRKQLLGSAYRLFYDNPVHLVRGAGVWLYDADGTKFLDM
jgi:4-aminobutyrate aminotransferase-like enzyme